MSLIRKIYGGLWHQPEVCGFAKLRRLLAGGHCETRMNGIAGIGPPITEILVMVICQKIAECCQELRHSGCYIASYMIGLQLNKRQFPGGWRKDKTVAR